MSDKILLIPPTTNQCQWPQNNQTDESKLIMEKQSQELQQQAVLKCPRCESSNTKFCYYNNYSLSQPRHFCKACKRYWTRGGTLRNVPVGGGYRRNKRSTTTTTLIKTPTTSSSAPSSTTSNLNISPMFYGLSSSNNNNSCDMNLPFSRFNNFLQPQMNSVGLGFSSDNGYTNGFNTIFSSSASNDSSVVMPSLLSNTLLQHKFMNDGVKYGSDAGSNNNFQGLEKKVEGQNSKLEWNGSACQNQMEYGGGGLYDPSSLYWNSAASSGIGVWNDQGSNIGSSVTSLI